MPLISTHNRGLATILLAFAIWGLFPVYWKTLIRIDAVEILLARLILTAIACMKLLLPAMAAGLVILIIIWPQINAIDSPITVPIKIELEEQARALSMMNARFEGLDEKN